MKYAVESWVMNQTLFLPHRLKADAFMKQVISCRLHVNEDKDWSVCTVGEGVQSEGSKSDMEEVSVNGGWWPGRGPRGTIKLRGRRLCLDKVLDWTISRTD